MVIVNPELEQPDPANLALGVNLRVWIVAKIFK